MHFIKLFLFTDHDKKNDVGPVVAYRLLAGATEWVSSGSNVKTVEFYLLKTGLLSGIKIVFPGFENGL